MESSDLSTGWRFTEKIWNGTFNEMMINLLPWVTAGFQLQSVLYNESVFFFLSLI